MQIAAHLSGIAENSALLMKYNRITANNERVARARPGYANFTVKVLSILWRVHNLKSGHGYRVVNQFSETLPIAFYYIK